MTTALAAAYSATGAAWERGPARIYDVLADRLVACAPVAFTGRRVLDIGAGTGAATRAVLAAGARGAVAVDAAHGMLCHVAASRPAAVVGDLRALPFRDASFTGAIAAFSLNHVVDPVAGMLEMVRITRQGSPLLVGVYASDDAHPVKAAVEAAVRARGWRPEPWYDDLRQHAIPRLASEQACAEAAAVAGWDAVVTAHRVCFPHLTPAELVAWRLGLAQHAPFLAELPPEERDEVANAAMRKLGDTPPPLVRSVLVICAVTQ